MGQSNDSRGSAHWGRLSALSCKQNEDLEQVIRKCFHKILVAIVCVLGHCACAHMQGYLSYRLISCMHWSCLEQGGAECTWKSALTRNPSLEMSHTPCAAEKYTEFLCEAFHPMSLSTFLVCYEGNMSSPPVQRTSASSFPVIEWRPTMHLTWTSYMHFLNSFSSPKPESCFPHGSQHPLSPASVPHIYTREEGRTQNTWETGRSPF